MSPGYSSVLQSAPGCCSPRVAAPPAPREPPWSTATPMTATGATPITAIPVVGTSTWWYRRGHRSIDRHPDTGHHRDNAPRAYGHPSTGRQARDRQARDRPVHARLGDCLPGRGQRHGRAQDSKPNTDTTPPVAASGPCGKFCNAQPWHKRCGQGTVRREWQALYKGCNTAHNVCAAALREPLCGRDSALRFLPREQPLPAKRALIRTRTAALSATELSAWPTSRGHQHWNRVVPILNGCVLAKAAQV